MTSRAQIVNRHKAVEGGSKHNNCLVSGKECQEIDNTNNEESTGGNGRTNTQQLTGCWKLRMTERTTSASRLATAKRNDKIAGGESKLTAALKSSIVQELTWFSTTHFVLMIHVLHISTAHLLQVLYLSLCPEDPPPPGDNFTPHTHLLLVSTYCTSYKFFTSTPLTVL